MEKILLTMIGLTISGLAIAHPGHDHSSWTAPLLHALWVAPAVVAVVAGIVFLRKKITK